MTPVAKSNHQRMKPTSSLRSNRRLTTNGPFAAHEVFKAGQLFGTDRSTCMHLARGDTDLGSHAEFTAVRELG